MDHKVLEAKAVATELGEFTAIAAAYSVDRSNERIVPGAFKSTIENWQASGKQIPLHWDHMGEAENIIGVVDPSSMQETEDGLQVKGKVDLEDSAVAKEAWRLMKKNVVALSFGYLVLDEAKGENGVRELKALDVFEITITPAPMNPDTRFLGLKALVENEQIEALTKRVEALEKLTAEKPKDTEPVDDGEPTSPEDQGTPQDPANAHLRTEILKARASAV